MGVSLVTSNILKVCSILTIFSHPSINPIQDIDLFSCIYGLPNISHINIEPVLFLLHIHLSVKQTDMHNYITSYGYSAGSKLYNVKI